MKLLKPVEETDSPQEERVREKDLKGHIKPAREDGTKLDESRIEEPREIADLAKDNQLKAAVDILNSWHIMKNHLPK